jgi:predicted nuclease with RNAse H fold
MSTQHTLGVDLASAAEKTAMASIIWADGRARLVNLQLGVDDETLLATPADVIGIDAPFGWPLAFQAVLNDLKPVPAWTTEWRDRLRFRETDRVVRALCGRWPLSVSTDLIGVPALRCHGLLSRWGVTDRSGDGRLFEVYPAGALQRWGLPSSGYKKKDTDRRDALIAALSARAPWLDWGPFKPLAVQSHDALDAVIAALNTRAAGLGLTVRPDPAVQAAARIEGWLAVPDVDAFDRLAAG